MKLLRKCLLGLGVLVLAAAVLLWFLPARWALPWIEPQLHGLRLQQVQGSLWDGRAAEVVAADGQVLGRLQWQLSRRALLGHAQLELQFAGPQLAFSGGVQRLADARVGIDNVDAQAQLAALDAYLASPLGQPRGELQLMIEHAVLQGGWPLQLQAHVQWHAAVMHTRDGNVALGSLQARVQAQDGMIRAQLRDDGHGPLRVDGELQLSPLGWRLDATLQARQTDPALRHWLADVGTSGADGSVHVRRSGGLAPASPTH